MLRVLGRKTSGNVQKVVWLLEEMKQPYTREDYGRQFGNTADAAYLGLNPNGKVPTLVDGDVVVWESNTILRYLCNEYGGSFYPSDPATRSLVERWMDWQLSSLNDPYLAIFREAKKPAAERPPGFPADAKALDQQLGILDGGIGDGGWLAGRSISLAEFCLAPIVERCLNFPIDLSALPKLRKWSAEIRARPDFKSATA